MKKCMICVALLVVIVVIGATVCAQGYIHNPANTPSVGGGNAWPFGSYPAWRFQFIVDAKVLPAALFKITELGLAFTGSGTKTIKQLQVRMGHTTHKNFSGSGTTSFVKLLGPCPTECFNGPLTWPVTANQWEDIGLQAPFAYDGQRNIVVEIRYQGGSGAIYTRTDASIARAYVSTQRVVDPYNSPTWFVPIYGEMMGPIHRLTYVKDNMLFVPDTTKVGSAVPVTYVNGPGGHFYQIAASLGQRPAIFLGKCKLFLAPDNLFIASILGGPPVFNGYAGILSAQGNATAKFSVPLIKPLVGLCVYHAGVAYDKSGVTGCTNTDGTQLVP